MAKRTKRKNTRRRVSKKNKTRKRMQRKRNKIGGSEFFQKINKKLENLAVEGEELNRKADRLGAQSTYWKVSPGAAAAGAAQVAATPEPAAVAEPVEPAPESENQPAFNILNKFFKEVVLDGWFGGKSYELNPTKFGPNNKINVISAHGRSTPDKFFIVPDGLILYLSVSAGDPFQTYLEADAGWATALTNKNSYFREYKGGSLIQDYILKFKPISKALFKSLITDQQCGRAQWWDGAMGLLELDAPDLTVKNATEANKELINFLAHTTQLLTEPQKEDIKKDYKENLVFHLEEYAPIYFENNIDDIINKNDLILSATEQKQYYLSNILRLIARKRKGNSSISGEWFGTFCRSGEFIDINKFKNCQEDGLPLLPEGFFQGDFHYEGVDLVRQESLASSDPTINFKKILDEVYEKIQQYDDSMRTSKNRMERIKRVGSRGLNLGINDICFVFQMKQKMVNEGKW